MEGIAKFRICLLFSILLIINLISEALHDKASVQELTYIPAFDDHRNSSLHQKSEVANVKTTLDEAKIDNLGFAGGMVSVDCLRCLCLKLSDCKPVGCEMRFSVMNCGYFQITRAIWTDCGKIGPGWKKCADDVMCSSQCIQNYMKRYAQRNNCMLNCEGYTREIYGGPNGCNNPTTIPYWNAVQKVPGCKGVE